MAERRQGTVTAAARSPARSRVANILSAMADSSTDREATVPARDLRVGDRVPDDGTRIERIESGGMGLMLHYEGGSIQTARPDDLVRVYR